MPNFINSKQHIAAAPDFLALSTRQAFASSDNVWDELKDDIEQAYTKSANEIMKIEAVKVDPSGSETFAYAVINGFEKGRKSEQQVICVLDKKSETVDTSGFFDK